MTIMVCNEHGWINASRGLTAPIIIIDGYVSSSQILTSGAVGHRQASLGDEDSLTGLLELSEILNVA